MVPGKFEYLRYDNTYENMSMMKIMILLILQDVTLIGLNSEVDILNGLIKLKY